MNILVMNSGAQELQLIDLCKKSKLLNKIYTASDYPLDDIPNIEYESLQELVQKAKSLQIDIILVCDAELIESGFVDYLKKNLLNVIAVNQKWFNLESSRLVAKQLLNYYSINTPKVIKAPSAFPVVIKSDRPFLTHISYSMEDLVVNIEKTAGKRTFMEELLDGEVFNLLSLWDGKSLIHFDLQKELTEVQKDRLDLYKTKLTFLFSDESPDFIGFFSTKIIWSKNDWYVLEFIMHLGEDSNIDKIDKDFLYLLNAAIYQKLNEI